MYIQTNLGYFKRSLGAVSPFIPVSEAEAQPYLRVNKAPVPSISQLFRDTEALGKFARTELVYPTGNDLYWLSSGNEAGLFHVADGIGTLKCRLLFDNYNMNLVTRGKRIIPLNDSLVLASAMQGALLINIRELIGSSLGNTPLKISGLEFVDASGIHRLPINTQHISLPHNFQEVNLQVGTTIFTPSHQISYKIEGVSSDWSAWQTTENIFPAITGRTLRAESPQVCHQRPLSRTHTLHRSPPSLVQHPMGMVELYRHRMVPCTHRTPP